MAKTTGVNNSLFTWCKKANAGNSLHVRRNFCSLITAATKFV